VSDLTPTRILYDLKLRRPGCVILQALVGGSFAHLWPSELWLVNLTDDMKTYAITREEAAVLAAQDVKIHAKLSRRREA
jgi:hypothetical protein